MFKTALRDTDEPERIVRTSCPLSNKRFRVSFKKVTEKEEELANYSTLRPFTSPIASPKMFDTLNTTGKSSHLVNMRSIDAVENQMNAQHKGEMGKYLKRKLRHMVGKRKEDIAQSRYMNSTIDNPELDNTSHSAVGPLDQFYSILNQKSRLRVEKGVDGAYVSNAKQQITRLIYRKREQQVDFHQLNHNIRTRNEQIKKLKTKTLKDQYLVPAIQTREWDQQWRDSTIQQKTRYRKRLSAKHNHENNTLWLASFNQ